MVDIFNNSDVCLVVIGLDVGNHRCLDHAVHISDEYVSLSWRTGLIDLLPDDDVGESVEWKCGHQNLGRSIVHKQLQVSDDKLLREPSEILHYEKCLSCSVSDNHPGEEHKFRV